MFRVLSDSPRTLDRPSGGGHTSPNLGTRLRPFEENLDTIVIESTHVLAVTDIAAVSKEASVRYGGISVPRSRGYGGVAKRSYHNTNHYGERSRDSFDKSF